MSSGFGDKATNLIVHAIMSTLTGPDTFLIEETLLEQIYKNVEIMEAP